MESFIFVEKKQSNNKNYFLISNYSRSLVLDESTLKNKILAGEFIVNNLNISNNKLVEIPNTTQFLSEKELFYFYLSDRITVNCNTDIPMKAVVSKLKEINRRKIQFDNDKETVISCLLLFKRFFEYLGKTDFKFLGQKYHDMLVLSNADIIGLKLENYSKIDKVLNNYIKDGTLTNWYNNRNSDVYCYKDLYTCLDKLYHLSYSEDRKKKISAVLEVLGVYFDEVKPNMCGLYLYGYYMLQISEGCIEAIKSHTNLQIPSIDVVGRKDFLKQSAGRHEKQYEYNRKQILKNSRHFNKMVKKYGKETRQILDCLKETPDITSIDIANLTEILKKYTGIIEKKYKEIMNSLINQCNKNNNTDVLSIIEGLSDLTGCLEISELQPIGAIAGFMKIGFGARDFMKHKLESCLNDNLFSESQELLRIYRGLSIGQQGTLFYVLDKIRLQLVEKQPLEKRKKLKLYSNIAIVPLIDSMMFRPYIVWRGENRGGYLKKELMNIEISWLTTYYIMNEKVDSNNVYIRRNNALISWKFFNKCLKLYIPDVKYEELVVFKSILIRDYHWDLEKEKEINLLSLLNR